MHNFVQAEWLGKKETDFYKLALKCAPKAHFWLEPVKHVEPHADQARIPHEAMGMGMGH